MKREKTGCLDCVALAAALQAEESSRRQQQEQALPEDVEERRREGEERWRRLRTLRSGKKMAKGFVGRDWHAKERGRRMDIYASLRPVRGNCNGQSGSKTNNPTVVHVVPQGEPVGTGSVCRVIAAEAVSNPFGVCIISLFFLCLLPH
jgi:hypothetical protein